MYHYFTNKQHLSFCNKFCSDKLNRTVQMLESKYNLNCEFYLVGSGARNMVTQNENQPIDLDYNLIIYNLNNPTENAPIVKKTVMDYLNGILDNTPFSNCQDSTAVITSQWKTDNGLYFSFDIAILIQDDEGCFHRMIHDKYRERYYWVQIPDSSDLYDKVDRLKGLRLWQQVRDTYLHLKNLHLRNMEESTHPSFKVFVEAVNEVWDKNHCRY